MPKLQPARSVWRTEDRALDWERWRFLETMDEQAPKVWEDLVDGDRDVGVWARRHNLDCPWVRAYAENRLRRVKEWEQRADGRPLGSADPWETRWCPVLARPEQPLNEGPPMAYDPRVIPRKSYLMLIQHYMRRQEAAAAATGAAPPALWHLSNLRRLVHWHVLGESPETIAAAELAAGRRGGRRAVAEEVRRVVRGLAEVLGLPPRPRGRPGRRQKTPR